MQNSASGDGVLAQPKVSDVAYIRDTYFSSVYEMVNNSMTANAAPNTTLRGKHQAVLLSVVYSFCIGMVQWYIGHMLLHHFWCCIDQHLTSCADAIPENIQ